MQFAVFVLQLAVFGYQAWKLRETVEAAQAQSIDTKNSIAESARAATAMEGVSKSVAISAEAAKESVASIKERTAMQMRAYLTVVVGSAVYQEREKNVRFEGKPLLLNTGQTPAQKVGVKTRAAILPNPLPEEFDFSIPGPYPAGAVLGPGQNYMLSAIVSDFVEDGLVAGIKNGTAGRFLHVWGTVTYEDIFKQPHHTNFYQILTWGSCPPRRNHLCSLSRAQQ